MRLYSSTEFCQSSGNLFLQYTAIINSSLFLGSDCGPSAKICRKHGGPSSKCLRWDCDERSASRSDKFTLVVYLREKLIKLHSLCLFVVTKSLRHLPSKYGMLIKLPTSPRSAIILSCLGKFLRHCAPRVSTSL